MALRQEEFTRLRDDVDLDRDRVLVVRCQAGDAGAFASLYARYYERLLRFCLRRLHDRHEAEDAAQEAFARAWKALPKFAGERRFYPWLTVIAGNICTDMLRRRSRSTPTEDVELGARPPLGVTVDATADEMIIAAADGALAHQALGRLSVRHRHVLALREDSGWTYQQIADHEGVEIGTIETLLWRARQALKREFLALSDSKGSFAGFLLGVGAAIRTVVVRSSHRAAALQQGGGGVGGGGTGALRGVFAGVVVTSAVVAAAFVAPHAFGSSHQVRDALTGPAGAGVGGSPRGSTGGTAAAAAAAAAAASGTGARLAAGPITPNAGSEAAGEWDSPFASPWTTPIFTPSAAGPGAAVAPAAAAASTLLSGVSGVSVIGSLAPALSGVLSGTTAAATAVKSLVPGATGALTAAAEGLGSVVSPVVSPGSAPGSAGSQSGGSWSSSATPSALPSTTIPIPIGASTTPGIANPVSTVVSALHLLGQE